MDWDPEIDTPATILIIGGNAIGIEAALYARFLGYSVIVADAARVGNTLLATGDDSMPGTWGELTTPLGLAALETQNAGTTEAMRGENSASVPTHREYVEQYLIPVAKTDLIYEAVEINSPVQSVTRSEVSAASKLSTEDLAEREFRVLINSAKRGAHSQVVDIVLDCVGLPNAQGSAMGGGLACGEAEILNWDSAEQKAKRFFTSASLGTLAAEAGKSIMLYGDSEEVIETVRRLHGEMEDATGARLLWLVPMGSQVLQDEETKNLSEAFVAGFSTIPIWGVENIAEKEDGGWQLRVQSSLDEMLDLECDAFASCCFSGANEVKREFLPESKVATTDPHYYRLQDELGDTEANREQVREAFALIGGRADLDLYATVQVPE
ncbi:MAG: hypothetical protein AAF394_09640 [Planctomycetota bacterium]